MEAAVEEAGSQRTQPTQINPTEVPEETQPQHSEPRRRSKGRRKHGEVTKYAEPATRAEANMAEMEEKFEERFAMLSMTAQHP